METRALRFQDENDILASYAGICSCNAASFATAFLPSIE